MENTIIKLTTQLQRLEHTTTQPDCPSDDTIEGIPPPSVNVRKSLLISRDEYTKSTQTIETAFIPCESCHGVQKSLRDVGKFVASICESQGLTSTLAKHMEQVCVIHYTLIFLT